MKTIKIITTALLLLFTVTAFAQTKEKTVKYINDLYKKAYDFTDKDGEYIKVESVTLDGQILVHRYSDGYVYRTNLMELGKLKIDYSGGYAIIEDSDSKMVEEVFGRISTETDAQKLKQALEHLIEILKEEQL